MKNFCSNCGANLNTGANFCASCGAPVGDVTTASQHQPKSSPRRDHQTYRSIGKKVRRIIFSYPKTEKPITEQGKQPLHKNAVWLFFVYYTSRTWILIPIFVFVALDNPFLWYLSWTYFLFHWLAAKITYNNYKFEVTSSSFRKHYGVIHKHTTSIPFESIQNINIRRSLMDRMLSLSHLEIETAGSNSATKKNMIGGAMTKAEGYVPGIDYKEADELKDFLLARTQEIYPGQTRKV